MILRLDVSKHATCSLTVRVMNEQQKFLKSLVLSLSEVNKRIRIVGSTHKDRQSRGFIVTTQANKALFSYSTTTTTLSHC